jgi:hypothetical protein
MPYTLIQTDHYKDDIDALPPFVSISFVILGA